MRFNLFYLVILLPLLSFSQSDLLDEVFDDGARTGQSNVIKWDLAGLPAGQLSIHFERKFTESLTLELGLGPMLGNDPFYFGETDEAFELIGLTNDFQANNVEGGFGFMVLPRYYFNRSAPFHLFVGPQYRYKRYNMPKTALTYADLGLIFGAQIIFGARFTGDLNFGIAHRNQSFEAEDSADDEDGTDLVFPIALNFGVAF